MQPDLIFAVVIGITIYLSLLVGLARWASRPGRGNGRYIFGMVVSFLVFAGLFGLILYLTAAVIFKGRDRKRGIVGPAPAAPDVPIVWADAAKG